jgi:hypothetical protein
LVNFVIVEVHQTVVFGDCTYFDDFLLDVVGVLLDDFRVGFEQFLKGREFHWFFTDETELFLEK